MTEGTQGGPEDGGRRPHPFYNWLSLTGLALAACNVTALAFFVLVGLVSRESGYTGLTLLRSSSAACWVSVWRWQASSENDGGRSTGGIRAF